MVFCFVEFCLSLFFSCLFLFFVLLIWFVFLQLLAIEKRLAIFSGRQQISLKSPTMRLTKVRHGKLNGQNRNKMGEDRERELTANHQQFNKWIQQIIGFYHLSGFFSCLFLFFVLLIWFVFLQLLAIEKRLAIFSGRQQISLKSSTMRLTKVRHGRLNGQNRNKMGEDRERELTANHQQFNKWIQQIIGFLTSWFFFRTCFYFVFFCFVSFLAATGNWEAFSRFQRPAANIIKNAYNATE